MDLNATLFAQMFWFLLFVLFTMKFIWPPLIKALHERREKIADGLAAAEKGRRELELAEHKAMQEIDAAKTQASQIIEQAQQRTMRMIEDAKSQARTEAERLLHLAQEEIKLGYLQARTDLQQEVSSLVLAVAEKLVHSKLDAAANQPLIDKFVNELTQEG